MPTLTLEQISALARNGSGNNEIEAVLGRKMTPEEKTAALKGRAFGKAARAVKREKVKLGSSDRHTQVTAERSKVDRVPPADPDRRKRLEADPVAWLRFYLAGTYTRPFERPHVEIVAGVIKATETRGRFVVAAERGIGKSAILWGMILFLALSGRHRFPVCIPWQETAKKRAFRFWKSALCFNDVLSADYPEYTAPFRHSRGVAQRVATTTWRDTGGPTGAQLTIGEGLIILPDRLGCIGGSTINGNPRGLNHPQEDGTILRPSIVMLDDVQDRGTAKSPIQVQGVVEMIDGDVAGCGDPGRDMPMLMACNCISANDVSERYLTHPEWHALRIPCVESWPDGWDDAKGKCRAAWEEWHERFLSGKGDRTYYRRNKALMTRGMKLSAPAAFKGAEKCPDPFYGVIRMYHRMGHEAFMAERQQRPVDPVSMAPYRLTRESMSAHVTHRPFWETPPGVHFVATGADINPSYGISWATVGFEGNHTAHLLAYGVDPLRINAEWSEAQKLAAVFAGLAALRRKLDTCPCRPRIMAYDVRGWDRGHALAFAAQAERDRGLAVIPAQGTGWKSYRPNNKTRVGDAREQCHMAADEKGRKYLVVHADYWREVMQLAFATSPGAPGSCSLPAGEHGDFVDQILSEPLIDKKPGPLGMEWLFTRRPGRNDLSDAMVMAYAAAAYGGIGTGGQVARRRYIETRKSRTPIEN
ncbi:MAG: hypothetical protein RIQ93_2142 [Verrucomicrobiota bacterium]|jgi:hypothetical protein